MEPKEHFKLLSISIEGSESQLNYDVIRTQIAKKIKVAVERQLYGNISCVPKRESRTYDIIFDLEGLTEIIQTEIQDLFPKAEENSIHIILDLM